MLKLVERGSRLQTLNLLAGSTTVAGAVFTQILLRSPCMLGLAIVAAWALSPLGGQASLRIVDVGEGVRNDSIVAAYMSVNKSYNAFDTIDMGAMGTLVDTLFGAAVIAPADTKASPLDLWGNVKIPMIEPLATEEQMKSNLWIDIPNSTVLYSSLVGIPTTMREGHGFRHSLLRHLTGRWSVPQSKPVITSRTLVMAGDWSEAAMLANNTLSIPPFEAISAVTVSNLST